MPPRQPVPPHGVTVSSFSAPSAVRRALRLKQSRVRFDGRTPSRESPSCGRWQYLHRSPFRHCPAVWKRQGLQRPASWSPAWERWQKAQARPERQQPEAKKWQGLQAPASCASAEPAAGAGEALAEDEGESVPLDDRLPSAAGAVSAGRVSLAVSSGRGWHDRAPTSTYMGAPSAEGDWGLDISGKGEATRPLAWTATRECLCLRAHEL